MGLNLLIILEEVESLKTHHTKPPHQQQNSQDASQPLRQPIPEINESFHASNAWIIPSYRQGCIWEDREAPKRRVMELLGTCFPNVLPTNFKSVQLFQAQSPSHYLELNKRFKKYISQWNKDKFTKASTRTRLYPYQP